MSYEFNEFMSLIGLISLMGLINVQMCECANVQMIE